MNSSNLEMPLRIPTMTLTSTSPKCNSVTSGSGPCRSISSKVGRSESTKSFSPVMLTRIVTSLELVKQGSAAEVGRPSADFFLRGYHCKPLYARGPELCPAATPTVARKAARGGPEDQLPPPRPSPAPPPRHRLDAAPQPSGDLAVGRRPEQRQLAGPPGPASGPCPWRRRAARRAAGRAWCRGAPAPWASGHGRQPDRAVAARRAGSRLPPRAGARLEPPTALQTEKRWRKVATEPFGTKALRSCPASAAAPATSPTLTSPHRSRQTFITI